MEREIRKLRAALARRERGRGPRFSPELRRQISGIGRRLRSEGKTWNRIGATLGLPMATVQRLCNGDAAGFTPVEIVSSAASSSGLVVVTPTGFRIEGVDVRGAATLIRQLS